MVTKTTVKMLNQSYGTRTFNYLFKTSNPTHIISSTYSTYRSLSFPSHSINHNFTDYEELYRVLEASKRSLQTKTAAEVHARIIKYQYETYPSLVSSLISTYVHYNKFSIARRIIDRMFSWGSDVFTINLVIEKLMKGGECDIAKRVFVKMRERDVIAWNIMIGGYVKNGRYEDSLKLFKTMNVEPDGFTFASVIAACARLGALSNARWVHALMLDKKVEMNFILSAGLIDMYAKCSRIKTAKEIFESVTHDDVSVWNAMINGLAIHGLASDAIKIFWKMKTENVMPDSITFVGMLTACSHSGLIEEGLKFFNMMQHHFSIQPQLEHYGAMVDLLCRSGLLEQAYDVIKGMPMEPDVVIWRALLSSCRTFKKHELGEVAIANISSLKSGDFVLLSNIYCSFQKWNDAQKVREMMRKKGIHKTRGKSWIEFGGTIHTFQAASRSHPEMEAIHRMLDRLVQRTKLEGFKPLTELVLMDVSEEEKEENLHLHSEKLALAYGILKTSPGTEIMISKNLRICHDCHGWIKIISRLLCRRIILRDRIRFHSFEGGFCSCQEHW